MMNIGVFYVDDLFIGNLVSKKANNQTSTNKPCCVFTVIIINNNIIKTANQENAKQNPTNI